MKVHLLIAAVIWATACAGATSTFAGNSTASPEDDSAVVFASANLIALQNIGGRAKLDTASAYVETDVLRSASGNIGVNLAAGALNAQANQIALVATPQAEIVTQQNTHAVAHMTGGSAIARLGAGALAGASGNIGINIAAGAGNAQFNGLVTH
ncbi:hypothetical protein [Paraburkholderia ferrariae]|uniref:hypothetical protein n=1 Tax=Paraburkholderia ferrariae TaxID=386056 RepID=UPI000694563E|nr:hypothetical protein [Paraburkholderia ferrariae]